MTGNLVMGSVHSSVLSCLLIPFSIYSFTSLLRWFIPGPQHLPRFDFKNKTVLITGASTGLGRAFAISLYRKGAKLILTARSVEKLKELCGELIASGEGLHEPIYRYLDLAEPSGISELPSLSLDGQTIHVLINNAGLSMRGSVEETDVSVHRTLFEVNYFGHVAVTRELLGSIPDDGMIIVTISMQGKLPLPFRSAYSASKHALQAFFDCLRSEHRPNLHILVVSAGYLNTGFGRKALDVTGKPVGKEDVNQARGLSPEAASSIILEAAEKRQLELILAPLSHRIAIFIRWLWPTLYFYLMYRRGVKDELMRKQQ